MRIVIEEITGDEEEQIIIRCRKLTPKIANVIDELQSQDHLFAYRDNCMQKVPFEDVYYLETVDNKSFLYTVDAVYELKKRLNEIEKVLSLQFVRISRTVIVNWQKIQAFKPIFNGRLEATLENNERLIVSRQYIRGLKEKLQVL